MRSLLVCLFVLVASFFVMPERALAQATATRPTSEQSLQELVREVRQLRTELRRINSAMYKAAAFGISALYTGTAGALGAVAVGFVAPDSFTSVLSINFLVGVVIGGLASVSGALWGALFIQFVPNVAEEISKAAPWAIYGIFMIAFAYVMPTGVAGFLRLIWQRLTGRR